MKKFFISLSRTVCVSFACMASSFCTLPMKKQRKEFARNKEENCFKMRNMTMLTVSVFLPRRLLFRALFSHLYLCRLVLMPHMHNFHLNFKRKCFWSACTRARLSERQVYNSCTYRRMAILCCVMVTPSIPCQHRSYFNYFVNLRVV